MTLPYSRYYRKLQFIAGMAAEKHPQPGWLGVLA